MENSFLRKFRLAIEVSLIVAFLYLLFLSANRSKDVAAPKVTYEEKFIPRSSAQKDIEAFVGENIPENSSLAYVPVYSHIYSQFNHPLPIVVILSMRNTDVKNSINIHEVLYYNTSGDLIRTYLKDGVTLKPMETKEIFIHKKDHDGGSGANFLVLFNMTKKTSSPIFETVMMGGGDDQGFAFTSRGKIFYNFAK